MLDSFAVLSFFQAEEGSEKVQGILELAMANRVMACLSAINLGEIYCITTRKLGRDVAEELLDDIGRLPIRIEDVSLERILDASRIKAEYPLAYADAFAVSLGKELGMPIVTGDPEFKAVESLVEIVWLD